jgi:hypothetical protein
MSLVTITAAVTGCTTPIDARDDRPVVSYTCGHTVVIGRMETIDETPICDDDGICWSSLKTATLHVERALVGSRNSTMLKVRYGGHGQLRDDEHFMFVMERLPDGEAYNLVGADLMNTRPRLAKTCDRPATADADGN